MAGRIQKAIMRQHPPADWQERFIKPSGYSQRVLCAECGTSGYPGHVYPQGWQVACLLGHPDRCPDCRAPFVKGGLSKHLNCRAGHGKCADHADTNYRRLQRVLAKKDGAQ